MNNVLSNIRNLDNQLLEIALGSFAKNISGFAKEVSLDHPDLSKILNGIFSDNSKFLTYLDDAVKIAQFIYEYKLFSPYFDSSFRKFSREENFQISQIDAPSKNGQFIRLIENEELRTKARKRKTIRKVYLDALFAKEDDPWSGYPFDFSMYEKGSLKYLDEIAKAKKLYDKYQSFSLPSLAEEISTSIQKFEKQFKENCLGFNKLKVANAAIILAKFHNCDFNNLKTITRNGQPYNCYIYPYYLLEQHLAGNVRELISNLENNFSLFDHYFLLCPCYGSNTDSIPLNIEKKIVSPALMGEKDGVCYFLEQLK